MTTISITNSKTEQPKLFIRYHIPSGLPTTSNALMTDLNIHCHLKPRCLSSKDVFPFSFRMMGVPAPPWTAKTPCTGSFLGEQGNQRPGQEHMGVSENSGTPKSSILIGFSIINHPFWGTTIFGNTHMEMKGTSIKVAEFLSFFRLPRHCLATANIFEPSKPYLVAEKHRDCGRPSLQKRLTSKHREICSIFRPSKSCVVFDFKQNAFLLLHTRLCGNWVYIHCWTNATMLLAALASWKTCNYPW